MGMLDKFLDVMRLNSDVDDYDDYDDDYYDYDDYDDVRPKKKSHSKEKDYNDDDYDDEKKPRAVKTTKVTPMRPSKRQVSGMEVCVFKPISFEDAREITETLLLNRTIVLNVEGLDVDIAQRIIDFVSGSSYAVNGNLQKISNYIFLITPSNVDISGDFSNIMDAFDIPPIQTDF